MAREWLQKGMIPSNDSRRLIARLAVGMAAADGHVRSQELVALTELDLLGLGHLSDIAQEEMLAAVDEPIDLRDTCAGLVRLGPATGALILTLLSRLAASDGSVSPGERGAFETIARGLEVSDVDAAHILDAAIAAEQARSAPPAAARERPAAPPRAPASTGCAAPPAYRLLGVEQGASRERLEAAYLAAVERYDPTKMLPLGIDFVRLSIRKLGEITEAFERAAAAA